MIIELTIAVAKVIVIFSLILGFVPVMIWMERKGAAYIQDRRGPNRASIAGVRLFGVIHSLADAVKLFTKEEIANESVSKPLFYLAPIIAMFIASVTMAVIPFAAPVNLFGYNFTFQIVSLDAGLIYVFAMSSLGVYALLIAGSAASGKYPLLGSLRAAAQLISYELAMGLSVIAIFIFAGSLRLEDIIASQGPSIWDWNIIRQPLAFLLFITALFAETNRLPFDLPEGESELVAGYHTEYSSMRFALFFMAEYAHIIVGALIIAALFLGGWQIPFVTHQMLLENSDQLLFFAWPITGLLLAIFGGWLVASFKRRYKDMRDFEPLLFGLVFIFIGAVLLCSWAWMSQSEFFVPDFVKTIFVFAVEVITMLIKAFFFCSFFIWVRWTLPRFRYDQLMNLGWKVMLPLGILNVVVTSAILVIRNS